MKPFQRLYQRAVEDTGEVEDRERYRPGGYHPIHFNDSLGPDQQFDVVHKIGWSVNSTVWLCFDKESRYYRSVKVMTAEESAEDCQELQIMKTLSDISREELSDNYIGIPHDYFWHQGPNGRHLCLVSDLLGPSLFRNSPLGTGLHTPEILTDLTFQIIKGLQYLHKKGICHGDLRPSNILLQLHQYSLMELSNDQLNRYLGPREYQPLRTLPGIAPSSHGPRYLALPASLDKIEIKCRTRKVALVDFSHSFYSTSLTNPIRWHRQYAGPELLFTKALSGLPRDIWALACTIYEVKLKTQLFSEYQDYKSLIRQMELWFGPLPVKYRQIASTYLSSRKLSASNASSVPQDRLSNPHQLLSLSTDEEKQRRNWYMEGSEWPNLLQAALGREERCFVYEKDLAGNGVLDDTDSSISDWDSASQNESSDEGSGIDVPDQSDLHLEKTGNLDRVSEDSKERNSEEPNSSPSEVPTISAHSTNQPRHEQDFPETGPLIEVKETSQDHDTGEEEGGQTNPPPSPPKSSKDSKQESNELVELVVCMPREEVLLLSDLLMRMFKYDPKERIDIDTVVNHEYWGDRRSNWGKKQEDLGEEIPDPISSRTRSRVARAQQQVESGST
ncbi:kinase-like domain-containing protein [Daldinia caldariorum]|uniref:kinase-like domain-containing protein n=1 Tax=Daldinia caldariorum TaxID=326644 RepID=UPI00200792BB|nr:kinase-like domain-containing protein [Daldinia caldariorum]KAI1470909.1 kinase-like domain-containing protein [Daldinia caldariorum]